MSRYADGEYIYLIWEDWPDCFFVRGHVPFDQALETLLREEDGIDPRRIGAPFYAYARWSMERDMDGDARSVLRDKSEPGRGCFKVTKFPYRHPLADRSAAMLARLQADPA